MLWAIPHFSPLVFSGAQWTREAFAMALQLWRALVPWILPVLIGAPVRRVVGQ